MGCLSFLMMSHHLHRSLRVLSFLCVVLFSVQEGAVWGSDSDKSVLLELKDSLSDPSGVLSSWDLNSPDHCVWAGVSCDSVSRVVALNVSGGGNSLSCARIAQFPLYGFGIRRPCLKSKGKILGKVSPSIAKLTGLRVLSLPFNELSGEIPAEIWGMESLENLNLEGNLISGSLPAQFSGLKNLKVLNLGFNEIFGGIPSSLSACVGLEVLNLAGNQIKGSIPAFIGNFKDLRGLYLSYNILNGPIPLDIGDNCRKLEYLELSGNYLSEGIPKSLGNCSLLKTLVLFSNMLEYAIPSELGRLSQLEVLDVSRNSLSGTVPSELGRCSNLSVLVLTSSWDPLPNITSLGSGLSMQKLANTVDEYNFYEGAIPIEVTSLSSLRVVWAPRATLEGMLPLSWGSCDNLEMLNLAQNFYSGHVPEGFSSCKKLHFLDLSSNRLSGEILDKLPVPCMTRFDISGNSLTGSIPRFNGSCTPVQSIYGEFQEPYDPSAAYISYFGYRTQMETSLPFFEDAGTFPVIHNFGSNNFTGLVQSLPFASERFGKQTVYAFLAAGNKLAGSFPGGLFDKCDQVRGMIVNVSENSLSGQIPTDIGTRCKSLLLLDASVNQLMGGIPSSIGDLVSLDVLNLSWNHLQGPIPSNLSQIKDIRGLSLAGNALNGSIPASFAQLHSLEVLDLSSNYLSGEIPQDFENLRNLKVLLLNNNKLSGQIPAKVANITNLSTFNVSFNNFSGPLPLNYNSTKCNCFLGNPFLQACPSFLLASPSTDQHGDPQNDATSPSSSPNETSERGGFNAIEIASITSSAAIVSVLVALIVLFFYTRKWKPRSRVSGTARKEVITFTDIGVPLTFDIVVRATASFNASNCIGSGGFGATYKAEVAPGVLVAVKRLALGRFQGVQQFDAEIKTLGRLRHRNLVTLIGYHASETEMFLIYNYLPGGNLEKFIQERSTRAVDWRVLHKIALDIARALAYLHDQCVPRVLHRDVKPSNILLDEEHNAYLSDFGLARLLGTSETHATTGVAGTFGYVAPEYAMTCRVSDKADVYSYGVVLLELISDKKALDPSFSSYGNGFNIVAWACMLLRQGHAKEFFTAGLWDSSPHDDLVEVLHLAVVCTVDSLSSRPTMKQVVRRLKQLQPPSC
ncbi:hypothetical protein F511_21963 [Dorcoceras hygrometricum]|uniref:non-specific serine/threonine protein kinase n=1 Tax=Dorcoceras hygrometricum TaxID=472368 RepID=A0A2Z7CCC5_9LAMI|nr:hypothetical protein F511_21963 [Dorcoceras hygrometricum]